MLRDDPSKAESVAKDLNDVKKHLSHGAVIDAQRASSMGLKVRLVESDDDLWQAYWRLYCDMRIALQSPGQRLYEGRLSSLVV